MTCLFPIRWLWRLTMADYHGETALISIPWSHHMHTASSYNIDMYARTRSTPNRWTAWQITNKAQFNECVCWIKRKCSVFSFHFSLFSVQYFPVWNGVFFFYFTFPVIRIIIILVVVICDGRVAYSVNVQCIIMRNFVMNHPRNESAARSYVNVKRRCRCRETLLSCHHIHFRANQ